MQNKKQIEMVKKQMRRTKGYLGALAFFVLTLTGVISISSQARDLVKVLALRPAFTLVQHSTEENRTPRMQVRFVNVSRSPQISGE